MPNYDYQCTNDDCSWTGPESLGKCPSCGKFGTIKQVNQPNSDQGNKKNKSVNQEVDIKNVDPEDNKRISTGIKELNRVLGSGVVPGSIILIGGPPGIGKSTLLLQWANSWNTDKQILYLNGEESPSQIARRSKRIGTNDANIKLISVDEIEQLTHNLDNYNTDLVFVDSIQTITSEESGGTPGHPSQIRSVGNAVTKAAKKYNTTFVVVGHVTKEGEIGGPKHLEHMVDTVLYFDDSKDKDHRFLRSIKNRFGETGELGIFEMTAKGLNSLTNPGQFFSDTNSSESGSALTVSMEGTRPLLLETQALVTPTQYSSPQRSATGIPYKRLMMLTAVVEKKLGVDLNNKDIFVNIAGGLSLDDPGTDLAVTLAIISSVYDEKLSNQLVAIGEVGLTSHLRTPARIEKRIEEANRLTKGPVYVGGDPKTYDDSHQFKTFNRLREVANQCF